MSKAGLEAIAGSASSQADADYFPSWNFAAIWQVSLLFRRIAEDISECDT
ncbi:MAG TPA: hypothetical protein VKA94_04610 [Hyphomicrobiales bacterium]|nr:hypothetical protein [Hyphomicrobiales bacterium]